MPEPDREPDDEFEPRPHESMEGPVDWRLLRFLARHCATGVFAGLALCLGLLWTGAAGLDALIDGSDVGWIALLMLAGSFALTGGAVAMGLAVMGLARGGDG